MSSIRKVINRYLNKRGYSLVKYQRGEYLLDALIQKDKKFKFVQVGANDGIRFDNLYQKVINNRLAGLVIEPLPDFFKRLDTDYLDYPEVKTLNLAVHPNLEHATIYRVHPNELIHFPDWVAGISSFSKEHLHRHQVEDRFIIEERVKCQPLMKVLEDEHCLDATYFQSDTEGLDAEIIKMIDFSKFKPQLIKFESSHLNPDSLNACKQKLKEAGYITHLQGGDTIAYTQQLLSYLR